jgi:hypothetical protein
MGDRIPESRARGATLPDLRHAFILRKVSESWDYKRIMAITGHKPCVKSSRRPR